MPSKRLVARGYDTAFARYAELEDPAAPWPRTRWVDTLLRRLAPGSTVLDLGCATGVPVAARIAQRHHVTGVDISAEQIEHARANVPGGRFVCADATEVELPAAAFDAVVSLYTFDHIPRDEHRSVLQRIHAWLKPGGHLLVSIEDADQPGVVADWLGVDMFFSMFDADTTRRLVTEAGFELLASSVEEQLEGGGPVPYVWVLARKPERAA